MSRAAGIHQQIHHVITPLTVVAVIVMFGHTVLLSRAKNLRKNR